jgi:hypothetical protein
MFLLFRDATSKSIDPLNLTGRDNLDKKFLSKASFGESSATGLMLERDGKIDSANT